jgi:hypothetical protein
MTCSGLGRRLHRLLPLDTLDVPDQPHLRATCVTSRPGCLGGAWALCAGGASPTPSRRPSPSNGITPIARRVQGIRSSLVPPAADRGLGPVTR